MISKYHQSADPGETGEAYLSRLELLQYDMLYGDMEAYEGQSPYLPASMTMGSVPVTITDAAQEYHRLLVTGENFNEFSAILIDGQPVETAFIDETHIVARTTAPVTTFAVAQIAKDNTILYKTPEYEM